MPKQYTFKTTRATEWMESHLDSLPPSERSRFIRQAIADAIGSDKTTPSVTLSVPQVEHKVTPTPEVHTPDDEPLFQAKELDLESKLGSLFD